MSKGLEDFEELKKTTCFYCQYHINGECVNGECIWNNVEKSLKALEIIKEKGIILQFLKETYTVEQYNAGVFGTLVKPLTKEEYDLLKEVML